MNYALVRHAVDDLGTHIGGRVLERFLFPGLHLSAGRMITDDPVRAESLSALIAEALGLMAMIRWVSAS